MATTSQGKETPVTSQGKETPMTSEGKETPVTCERKETPVTSEGKETPVTSEGKETPVRPVKERRHQSPPGCSPEQRLLSLVNSGAAPPLSGQLWGRAPAARHPRPNKHSLSCRGRLRPNKRHLSCWGRLQPNKRHLSCGGGWGGRQAPAPRHPCTAPGTPRHPPGTPNTPAQPR